MTIKCAVCNCNYIPERESAWCPHNSFKLAGVLTTQVGGDHYSKLGQYQPWQVLQKWMTAEEFRGFMKGTAIAYLAREQSKGGREDIEKAAHTLRGYLELTEGSGGEISTIKQEEGKSEKHAEERNLHKFTGITDPYNRVF